jgi:hypothetical protein
MRSVPRRGVALLCAAAIACAALPAGAAPPARGRIEGLVIGLDGRTARGYRVHLIDREGSESALAVTDGHGIYSLSDVAPGAYAMAVESPEGRVAPIATPVRLGRGELRRHDLRLVEAPPADADAAASSGGLGSWWAGLSTAAKVWVIAGSAAVIGVTWAAIADDDDEEPASPTE